MIAGDVIVGDCEASLVPEAASMRLGEPEVQHLHGAVGSNHDVGRLQVAMHDSPLVRGVEGEGDLAGDGHGFVHR